MKKFRLAQSTLETAMIAILVLVGIAVMGPYVFRGVNAYMRSWEISAYEAKNNPTVQIAPWHVPGTGATPPPTCADACEYCTEALCDAPRCMWLTSYDFDGTSCVSTERCTTMDPSLCLRFTVPNSCCDAYAPCTTSCP